MTLPGRGQPRSDAPARPPGGRQNGRGGGAELRKGLPGWELCSRWAAMVTSCPCALGPPLRPALLKPAPPTPLASIFLDSQLITLPLHLSAWYLCSAPSQTFLLIPETRTLRESRLIFRLPWLWPPFSLSPSLSSSRPWISHSWLLSHQEACPKQHHQEDGASRVDSLLLL